MYSQLNFCIWFKIISLLASPISSKKRGSESPSKSPTSKRAKLDHTADGEGEGNSYTMFHASNISKRVNNPIRAIVDHIKMPEVIHI